MGKDLIATLARDKPDIGLLITLAPPTKAMLAEAAAAGFYTSPKGKKYARLHCSPSRVCSTTLSAPNTPTTNRTPGSRKLRQKTAASRSSYFDRPTVGV
jgi:hypothetical protein